MFIKGKPIRFGYKIWCLCGSDGYPYHMQIYQKKQSNANDQPLGTRVINNMVSIISSISNVFYHQLYFDNFFSSYRLMNELAEKSMRATGTIQGNRIHMITAVTRLLHTITAVMEKWTLLNGMTTLL